MIIRMMKSTFNNPILDGILMLSITNENVKIGLIANGENMSDSGIGQKNLKKVDCITHKNNSIQLNFVSQNKELLQKF